MRADDGSVVSLRLFHHQVHFDYIWLTKAFIQICKLREGLGTATNNVAEYRALILGLKYALKRGYNHICVQGDSKLACMQVCFVS